MRDYHILQEKGIQVRTPKSVTVDISNWTDEEIRDMFKLSLDYPECYFDYLEQQAKKRFNEWLQVRDIMETYERTGILLPPRRF